MLSFRSTERLLTVLLTVLILQTPAFSKEDSSAKKASEMPAVYTAMPALADLKEADLYQAGMKVGKEVAGKRYYSDGRLAMERDGQVVSVYNYQDSINGYMVYRMDHQARSYTIEQYLAGTHTSTLDSNGVYQIFNSDGTVQQMIDPKTFTAYYYEYETEQITETDSEGNSYPVLVIAAKNAYVNTAAGKTLYSTSTYTREGSSVTESIIYADGREEVLVDGVLVSSKTASGVTTDYAYKTNKKGDVVQRIETSAGKMRVVNVKKETPKAPTVNFGKVQRAVLQSVKNPAETYNVKTRDGNLYSLTGGGLNTFTLTTKNATYYFQNGVLLSTVSQDGRTIIRVRDAEYIRL